MRDPLHDPRHGWLAGPFSSRPGGHRLDRPIDLDDEPLEGGVAGLIAGYLGATLHGVLAYFPFLLTLFVAPLPVILGVYGTWLFLWRPVARWREDRPWLTLAVPLTEMVVWFAVMQVGWQLLGWPSLSFPENR